MQFAWDTEKEKINRKKHNVTFREACYVFADKYILTLFDDEHSSDEDRWITMGLIPNSRILVVVHTLRKIKLNNTMRGGQVMKKEYDFSKAVQGKFYRPIEELEIPIYLDKKVKDFFYKKALHKNIKLDKVINTILRKEMEMLKEIGA